MAFILEARIPSGWWTFNFRAEEGLMDELARADRVGANHRLREAPSRQTSEPGDHLQEPTAGAADSTQRMG